VLQSLAPLLLVVAVAGGVGALFSGARPAEGEPLADINHAIHLDRDLECVDCHVGVQTHAAAGVPGILICVECHEDEEDTMAETPNGRRILDHILAKKQLWWPQLYKLPDHVVFSHRRHVALGKIACDTCHGDMASSTTLPDRPVEATLTMDGCMDCHTRKEAELDCFACHR